MVSTADWDALGGAISDEDIRDGTEGRVAAGLPVETGRPDERPCLPTARTIDREMTRIGERTE
jgi:hypothetical protein